MTDERKAAERMVSQHFHEDNPSPLMQPEEDDHIRDDCLIVAEAFIREYPADSDEPTTTAWLLANGWTTYVHWPSFPICRGQLLEWRGAGVWIGETPICLAPTRGHVRRLLAALGVSAK